MTFWYYLVSVLLIGAIFCYLVKQKGSWIIIVITVTYALSTALKGYSLSSFD